ncbi:MAG TPA: hypothetical protein VHN99_09890 [Deinococcales bacterium]|nr:hypothetical protein [Deinococcales bacterium]
MATLEDVKRYLASHRDWSVDKMRHEVEHEFGMSYDEAAQAVRDFAGSSPAPDTVGEVPFSNAAVPAAALAGSVASSSANGVAAGTGAGFAAVALAEEEGTRNDEFPRGDVRRENRPDSDRELEDEDDR